MNMGTKTNATLDIAERILEDRDLRALCGRVGTSRISQGERRALVEAGLAYFKPNSTGRSGHDMILNALGRLAARHARLDWFVAEAASDA